MKGKTLQELCKKTLPEGKKKESEAGALKEN